MSRPVLRAGHLAGCIRLRTSSVCRPDTKAHCLPAPRRSALTVGRGHCSRELARFINLGRLHAKVDKVGGVVETNRPDSKNYQYQNTIKQGDILLNRIQKLSRVINI